MSSVLKTVISAREKSAGPVMRTTDAVTVTPNPHSSAAGDADDLDLVIGVLVENAPVAMAVFDAEMRYILANRQWITDFSLDHALPLVGRSQFEVFPHLHAGWKAVYERALQGHVVRSEHEVASAQGKPTLFRWELRPWRKAKSARVGGLMVTCERFSPSGGATRPLNPGTGPLLTVSEEAMPQLGVTEPPVATTAPPTQEAVSSLPAVRVPMIRLDAQGVVLEANAAAQAMTLARGLRVGVSTFWECFDSGSTPELVRQRTLGLLAMTLAPDAPAAQGMPTQLTVSSPTDQSAQTWSAYRVTEGELSVLMMVEPVRPAPAVALAPAVAPGQLGALQLEKRRAEEQLAAAKAELEKLQEQIDGHQRRELRLREVFDAMPLGLLVLDARGRPTFHNGHLRTMLGRSLEQGQSVEDWLGSCCLDAEHRDAVIRVWRENVWRRQLTRVVSLSTADGILKDVELRPVALPQGGGLVVRIQDVTDQCRLEEMLRATEARFRSVMHENPVAIVLTDAMGAVFEVNRAAEQLMGKPKMELRLTQLDQWLTADTAKVRRQELRQLAEGVAASAEMEGVLSEGGRKIRMRLAAVVDAEGRLHSVAHFLSAPEEPTAPAVPQMVEPLSPSLDLLLTTDASGRISEWTPAAEGKFGWSSAEMLGQPVHRLFRPSDGTGFYQALAAALSSGVGVGEASWPWFGKEGKGEAVFHLQPAAGGALAMQVCATGMAATSRLLLPQSRPKGPELPDLPREKLILTEVHHRVKNHLQILSSLLNLQSAALEDATARQALRASQNRIRAVAGLHQHLQDLSQQRLVNLDDLVRQLVGRVAECLGVPMNSISLHTSLVPMSIKEAWMLPVILILNEALSNSLEHAWGPMGQQGEHKVRLSIQLTTIDSQGLVQLVVQDDGVGLPADFSGHPESGLGLKIINVFADQLRGSVSLENIKPSGMRFILHFPMSCVDI